MKDPIYVTRPSMPELTEYIDEIKDIWASRRLTNKGPKHQELENLLKEYTGNANVSLYTNGHMALESVIEALELSGEVITSPFTFVSTTHALVRKGLKPVFCDINPDFYTMDANKIEDLVTEKTSAILPVHVYGSICDVDAIKNIADKYKLKIIYDAAHSFGVKVEGIDAGNFGDFSMYSFHSTKVFNTIEGGALFYSDGRMKDRLDSIANFGIRDEENVDYVSGNAKMSEFQAAMGICNLRHIDGQICARKDIYNRYKENLDGLKGVVLKEDQVGVQSNYAYFPVLFKEDLCGISRDEVYDGLAKEHIYARKYFYPLVSRMPCYSQRGFNSDTPVAEYISKEVLCLPMYADLSNSDVDRICMAIRNLLD